MGTVTLKVRCADTSIRSPASMRVGSRLGPPTGQVAFCAVPGPASNVTVMSPGVREASKRSAAARIWSQSVNRGTRFTLSPTDEPYRAASLVAVFRAFDAATNRASSAIPRTSTRNRGSVMASSTAVAPRSDLPLIRAGPP